MEKEPVILREQAVPEIMSYKAQFIELSHPKTELR